MKEELKSQMGDKYNESKINEYMKKAINKTVMQGCKNGILKVQYKINDLVDKFVENFNKIVQEDTNGTDSKAPFDKEEAIGANSTLAQQYIQGGWKTENDSTKIYIIDKLSESLREQLKSTRPNLSEADINSIINEAKSATLTKHTGKAYINNIIDDFLSLVETKISALKTK